MPTERISKNNYIERELYNFIQTYIQKVTIYWRSAR